MTFALKAKAPRDHEEGGALNDDGDHVKVLQREVALEIHRSQVRFWAYPVELVNMDSRIIQLAGKAKTIGG